MKRLHVDSGVRHTPLAGLRHVAWKFACVAIVGAMNVGESVRADDLVAYACGRSVGGWALMTIVLPAEWSYEPKDQPGMRVQKFVFTNSAGAFPYLWTEIEQSSAQTLNLRRQQATERPERELLSGGSTGETYYDSGRKALWSRTKDSYGTGGVSVTLFDQHVATFKFFDQRSHLAELEPVIIAIIDNTRLHALEDDVVASTEPVSLPDGVNASAFRRAVGSSGFPYLLCFSTVFVIAGLVVVESRIRRKRQQAQIVEIEQAQADRKARRAAREHRENEAAAAYLQATPMKKARLRRE